MDFDLFVIGGGSAGVRCARISAGYGARVGIAEERHWGGTCVNIGCVPKKLLVQAGEYAGWVEDAAGFGWAVQKGTHDWGKLIAAKAGHRIILASDGGNREHTVPNLRRAGAETVVLGSLAFGAPDLAARMAWVRGLERED